MRHQHLKMNANNGMTFGSLSSQWREGRRPTSGLAAWCATLSAYLAISLQVSAAETPLPLWELKKDQTTVYLLGSVHVLRTNDHPFPGLLDDVFEKSDQIIFEADLEAAKSPDKQPILLALSIYDDGSRLSDFLDPATYDDLQDYAAQNGLLI